MPSGRASSMVADPGRGEQAGAGGAPSTRQTGGKRTGPPPPHPKTGVVGGAGAPVGVGGGRGAGPRPASAATAAAVALRVVPDRLTPQMIAYGRAAMGATSEAATTPELIDVARDRGVTITWADGHVSRFGL